MTTVEIISLVGSIVAILAALWGILHQARELKQRDVEIRHKIDMDLKEFRAKYTSPETQLGEWLDDLGEPIKQQEDPHTEIGFPYLAGAPVRRLELFYGRRDLLAEGIKCANGAQMASMSILGARKSGKTSFLRFLEYTLIDRYPQIVPVYLDAQTPVDSCENFYAYMLRESMQALEKRKKNIARSPDLPKEVPFEMLGDFLTQAGSRQWRFLMLLDEFDNLVKEGSLFNEKFFAALRSLIQKGQLGWVTASYRFVYMPNTTTSPFSNIIQETHYVGPLSPQDAHRLVTEPAARFGLFFEKEDVDHIIKTAGRMPFLIQKASLQLYKSHINGVRGRDARSQLTSSFSLEMQNYFDSQLAYLKKEEYKTLMHVAKKSGGELDPDILRVLENYGFIEKPEDKYQVLGQTFDDYLYHRSRSES